MAGEELGHVAILRKARRRAYHQEHAAAGSAQGTVERFDAGALERVLAGQLDQMDGRFDPALAGRMRDLADEARLMATQAVGLGRFPAGLEQRDAETIAEALTDAYLEEAETSNDSARMEALQDLAAKAISRLAWLRSLATT